MTRTALALAATIALSGCATLAPVLQTAADSARATAKMASDADDRTAAARLEFGLAAGQGAVTIGCAMLADAARVKPFDGLRAYCAARR
jgi:hypothetical protein